MEVALGFGGEVAAVAWESGLDGVIRVPTARPLVSCFCSRPTSSRSLAQVARDVPQTIQPTRAFEFLAARALGWRRVVLQRGGRGGGGTSRGPLPGAGQLLVETEDHRRVLVAASDVLTVLSRGSGENN